MPAQAPLFEAAELSGRVAKLQDGLDNEELDGCAILQRADLLYYTGAVFQGALFVPRTGVPLLFAWRGASRIGAECPAQIRTVNNLGQAVRALSESDFKSWHHIGLEEDVLPMSLWRLMSLAWPHATFADVSPMIRWQRAVKSDVEIRYLREAAQVMCESYADVTPHIREGLPENVIQLELERALRLRGHQGFFRMRAFNAEAMTLVSSGESATVAGVFDGPIGEAGSGPAAPSGAGVRPLARGKPILIDGGSVVNGYHADMTRIWVIGSLAPEMQRAYDFCRELLEELAALLKPGAVPRELYEHALARADGAGFADGFMNRGPLKARFVGHGVGLELDEWPVIAKSFTQPLEINMTLAIEPKIVFDGGAVGIEDTFLITPRGGETLTQMDREVIHVP